MAGKKTVRLAVVGDVHCGKGSAGTLAPLFMQINEVADILALVGDLTDYGLEDEAKLLLKEMTGLKIPVVAVLGNHDFESGQQERIRNVLCDGGMHMLDGESCEIQGIGFAGTKGFGGGFGRRTLGMWGERAIKDFVHEAVNESLKLESALARLRMPTRIALLHYSPVRETVVGEPEEIYPFLGTSRLEEPLTMYPVLACFHGHAHHGSLRGTLANGTPVYNVSMPLLKASFPNQPPFQVLELLPEGETKLPRATAETTLATASVDGAR